jgi:hypothetical protein
VHVGPLVLAVQARGSFGSFPPVNLTERGRPADVAVVIDTVNLQQLIPTYRRDTDDITGAVRMGSIEMVSMEQMPGGKFQITVRTSGGAEYFITSVLPNLHIGREALEAYRARLGGEEPMYPVPRFVPFNASELADIEALESRGSVDVDEASELGDPVPDEAFEWGCDSGVENPLVFVQRRAWRRARGRHRHAPGRDVRSWRAPILQAA